MPSASPCSRCGAAIPPGGTHRCHSPEADKLMGQVLDGRYEIVGVLGEGGMGIVYEASQRSMRRPVAVKTLHPELAQAPTFYERFRREAEVASKLRHPNIITVYDFGRAPDGVCYYVMELLFGESLRQLVRREGPLSLARTIGIAEQVAKALAHAHREGVVHRDLKPHNIMLQPLDGADFVKVLDFGLMKALRPEDVAELTGAGQVLGTPQYMAPEQAAGEAVDPRSDLYALGAVLHFCLTGSAPFGAKTGKQALKAALEQKVPTVSSKRKGAPLPDDVEDFLQRAMHPKPESRFQDADDFVRELRLALASVTQSEFQALPEGGVFSGGAPLPDDAEATEGVGGSSPSARRSGAGRGAEGAAPIGHADETVLDRSRSGRGASGRGGSGLGSASAGRSHSKRPSPSLVTRLRTLPSRTLLALSALPLLLFAVGAGTVYLLQDTLFPPPTGAAGGEASSATGGHPPSVEKAPSPPVVVQIRSEPPGASVLRGTMNLGITPLAAPMTLGEEHLLTFRLEGHETVTRRFRPAADETLEVRLMPVVESQNARGP